jgi:hypothetical protein
MRVIIAGSRTITDPLELEKAIKDSGFQVNLVISGGASGVDQLGIDWANKNGIPIKVFLPDWKIYSKAAGPIRNGIMADNADALIICWDGKSRGSASMIEKATAKNLKIYIHLVKKEEKK